MFRVHNIIIDEPCEHFIKVCLQLHHRSTNNWIVMGLLRTVKEKKEGNYKSRYPNIHKSKYISLVLASKFLVNLEGSLFGCFLMFCIHEHSHKKQHSLETCTQLLFMSLQEFFASARFHRVHKNFCYREV